jgi:hypothetical protein
MSKEQAAEVIKKTQARYKDMMLICVDSGEKLVHANGTTFAQQSPLVDINLYFEACEIVGLN